MTNRSPPSSLSPSQPRDDLPAHRSGHRGLRDARQRPGRIAKLLLAVAGLAVLPPSFAAAQTMEDLLRRIDALQRRVDELETPRRTASRQAAPSGRASAAPVPMTVQPMTPLAPTPEQAAAHARVTRAEVDEALRGSMPNSLRIPGTETSIRLYGFAKTNLYGDLDSRNRSDAPSVQSIPLRGSAADRQNGDISFTARRSRVGLETQTPSGWGPVNTRLEMDFAGDQPSAAGAASSSGYMPRLRLAYAEVGGDIFRVLVGQNASLWNEGLIETLNDSTFLNASAVRQAQVRVTGRLAPGLQGQMSIEAPYTDYTSAAGVFYPDSTYDGGASPAINQVPDLLGRLNYRGDFGEAGLRGLVRQLKVDTTGTNAPHEGSQSTVGWGLATHANLALRQLWDGFGHDQLIGMAHYGQGIGRYFDSAYAGQGAITNLGLRNRSDFSIDAVPSWGVLLGYRHVWAPTLRSTIAYSHARQDNPAYVGDFAPGSAGALALNREMQMGVVNLIWSPRGQETNGRLSNGWLDVGLEYIYFRRDLEGGAAAAGGGQAGHGIDQRIQASVIARF